MDLTQILLIFVIIVVAIYDFTNGFHDTADMVATAIASRAMRASVAIAIVGVFTFIGPFVAGLAVADTIGRFVEISHTTTIMAQLLVISALLSAVSYNLITWKFGLPSSSSNSLAGGLVGAGLFVVGSSNINWGFEALTHGHLQGLTKVLAGLFVSLLFGFLVGFLIIKIILFAFRRFTLKIRPLFVFTQYISELILYISFYVKIMKKVINE